MSKAGGKAKGPRGRAPTPILVSRRVAVVLAALGAAVVAYVLWAAPSILVVALGGLALAVVLSYPVRALSRLVPRGLAILLTFSALVGLAALAPVFLISPLLEQLQSFVRNIDTITDSVNGFFVDQIERLGDRGLLPALPADVTSNVAQDLVGRAREIFEGALGGLFGFISGALGLGVTFFGVLFVAAYLLIDVRKMKASYLRTIPRGYRRDALELWEDFGHSLSRYLGGLLFVVLIQGVLAGVALWVLGVRYAVLLGVWVSVTAIIPYLGAFLGAIPALIVALIFGSSTFDSATTTAVLVAVAYVLIQQLDGNYLTPRIQGQALHVHPIIVLLAVIGGGQLAGLAGVVFAVPALAVLRVFFDFFRARLRTTNPPGAAENEAP